MASLVSGCVFRSASYRSHAFRVFSSLRNHNPRALYSSTSDGKTEGSDEEAAKRKKEEERLERTKEASQKLSQLLASIIKDSEKPKVALESEVKLDLAKPKQRLKPKVAGTHTGLKKKDLDGIDPKLITAAKDVSQSVPGEPQKTESELLQRLRVHIVETEDAKAEATKPVSLSNLFEGMKVEQKRPDMRAAKKYQGKEYVPRESRWAQGPREVSLFGGKPLGIFTTDFKEKRDMELPKLDTWDSLTERDICLSVTQPPANGFEEMILLTEQGKLWKFPIDNEQGMEEEKKVPFHEHVFLEGHLQPWCPKSGPVRLFMELVCVGLSKNPYITVTRKKEFIGWFQQYFEDKKPILEEALK